MRIFRRGEWMMLPKDPYILLSFLNAKLRDEYPSLEELLSLIHILPQG